MMLQKLLKLFILFYLFISYPCFAQTKQGNFDEAGILANYNGYLTAVHLKPVIKATAFSFKNNVSQNGSLGRINLTNVYVLTVEPDSALAEPLAFAGAWNNVVRILNGPENVYGQLFFKLADFTGLPPDSLVVLIKTSHPKIISYMVYFNKGIRINLPGIGARSPDKTPDGIKPESLNDVLYGCVFPNVSYSSGKRDPLIKAITLFLEQNDQGQVNPAVQVAPVYRAYNIIFFEARNFKGRITKKYYEDITVTLTIIPSVDSKKKQFASIGYTLNACYSARKFGGPANVENSENVIIRHKADMQLYGEKLNKLFIKIIYGANY